MKKHISTIFTSISFLFILAGVSASAQAQVTADIPFDFNVGSKTLPAGKYKVNKQNTNSLSIVVRNTEQTPTAMALSNNLVTTGKNEQSKLVFHRYGNQYFLAEVIIRGNQNGYELPTSKAERKAIEEARTRYLTKNEVKPEIVVIVAGQ